MSIINPDHDRPYNIPSPTPLIKPVREFRATGDGLMVTKPDLKATPFNANASLTVMKRAEGDRSAKMYLFVDRISTSWQISGNYAQAVASRTWMPRNLTMADLIIEGQVANQHEYDKLVVFIRDHMRETIETPDEIFEEEYAPVQLRALDFKLFPPGVGQLTEEEQARWALGQLKWPNRKGTYSHIPNINAARRIWMFIVVTSISAGHERFKFAPAFTLTCKVLWDVGDPDRNEEIKVKIMREVNYKQIYGDLQNPQPKGPEFTSKLPVSTYSGSIRRGGTAGVPGSSGGTGGVPSKGSGGTLALE